MAVRLPAAHRAGAVRTAEADAGLAGLGAFQVTFSGLALAASWLTPAVAIAWLVGLAAAAGAFTARGAGGGYRAVLMVGVTVVALPVVAAALAHLACVSCGEAIPVLLAQGWAVGGLLSGALLRQLLTVRQVPARIGLMGAGIIGLGLVGLQLVQLGAQLLCPSGSPDLRSCGALVPYALPAGLAALSLLAGIVVRRRGGSLLDAGLVALVALVPGAAALLSIAAGTAEASRADTLLLIAAGPLVLGAYVLAAFTPPTARRTTGLAARGR